MSKIIAKGVGQDQTQQEDRTRKGLAPDHNIPTVVTRKRVIEMFGGCPFGAAKAASSAESETLPAKGETEAFSKINLESQGTDYVWYCWIYWSE